MFSLLILLSGPCSVSVHMGTQQGVSISIEIVPADEYLFPQREEDHSTAASYAEVITPAVASLGSSWLTGTAGSAARRATPQSESKRGVVLVTILRTQARAATT